MASIYVTANVATITTGTNAVTATSFSTGTSFPITQGYAPLTTVFTQPQHCQNTLLAKQNYYVLGYQDDCYPSGYETASAYSPGICPSGFSMADLEVRPSLNYAITSAKPTNISVAYCCPRYIKPPFKICFYE
jgi:hypothetical protein